MRSRIFWILATSSALLATACSPDFDAENENNKREILSTRDEMTLRLAQTDESSGDLMNAEKQYMTLANNGSPQSTMQLAAFYTRHNQSQRAVEILDAAYKKSPKNMDLMRSLANALISAGNPGKALSMLDGAIAGHNELAYIYNSRGVALDKLSRYDEAQRSYQKAIALSPEEQVDFKTNLSMSYILAGKYNEAIRLLSPLVAADESTPGVRQNLALAYGLKGNMAMAMKIGSKDLTPKEMSENIRFYTLMNKSKVSHSSASTISSEPADLFPTLAAPPPPVSAEDAPPVTTVDEAPPAAPEEVPPVAAPVVNPITPKAQAAAPAMQVRNLSPLIAPQVVPVAPSAPVVTKPAEPEAKIIKPVAKPAASDAAMISHTPAYKKATAELPADEGDEDVTTPVKPDVVLSPGDSSIPAPALKPDKW